VISVVSVVRRSPFCSEVIITRRMLKRILLFSADGTLVRIPM